MTTSHIPHNTIPTVHLYHNLRFKHDWVLLKKYNSSLLWIQAACLNSSGSLEIKFDYTSNTLFLTKPNFKLTSCSCKEQTFYTNINILTVPSQDGESGPLKKKKKKRRNVINLLLRRTLQTDAVIHENGEFLLVYEFIPNGSLDTQLLRIFL